MNGTPEHITVCICTYKRPQLLLRLLEKLEQQNTADLFDFSVVIVDNDREESAKPSVETFSAVSSVKISYLAEPVANIAMARNRAVINATGDYLAFIDDDEFPEQNWLAVMLATCKCYRVSGVLGPVLPHFESQPPAWLMKAGFYDRKRHMTGFVMGWQEARTGNVLLKRTVIDGVSEVFRPQFGAGGEDQDFFRRMIDLGHIFIWCDEAPAYETVPPHRWQRKFLLRRALLRGRTTFEHPRNRIKNLAKSVVAVPLYGLALPFLLVAGHHHFMKYLVRFFDHAGRLLALAHLNPVTERNN